MVSYESISQSELLEQGSKRVPVKESVPNEELSEGRGKLLQLPWFSR